jgi:hypothetical protein
VEGDTPSNAVLRVKRADGAVTRAHLESAAALLGTLWHCLCPPVATAILTPQSRRAGLTDPVDGLVPLPHQPARGRQGPEAAVGARLHQVAAGKLGLPSVAPSVVPLQIHQCPTLHKQELMQHTVLLPDGLPTDIFYFAPPMACGYSMAPTLYGSLCG